MMFLLFQYALAKSVGLGAEGAVWVVALQVVGGTAGNMICVHNIVAAWAPMGLVGRGSHLIHKVLIPLIYYVLPAGALGVVLIVGGLNF